MQTNRTRSLIAIVALAATSIVGLVFSVSKSITPTDLELTNGLVVTQTYNVLRIAGSGTPNNHLQVDGAGHVVHCLQIEGNYVDVYNFIVDGCPSHGILIGKNRHDILILNNVVRYSVTENGSGQCSGTGGWGSGIKSGQGTWNVIIQSNLVYKNCGEGIDTNMSHDVTIIDNVVYDNFSVGIYLDNGDHFTVLRNVVSYTGDTGYYRDGKVGSCFLLGAEDYTKYGYTNNHLSDVLIEGNTLINCKPIGFWNPTKVTAVNVVIRNNVVSRISSPYSTVPGAIVSGFVTATPTDRTTTPSGAGTPTPTIAPSKTPTRISSPTLTRTPTAVPTISTLPTVTPTPDFMCPLPYTFIQSSEYWLCIFKK